MPSPVDLQSEPLNSGMSINSLLKTRSEYQTCHIWVSDLEKRLAALCIEGRYYSLFKVVKDQTQALEVVGRLLRRGDQTVITQAAKGYVIWVWEPDAKLATSSQTTPLRSPNPQARPFQILTSRSQYRPCHIRVPDLDQRIAAIAIGKQYYSFFKLFADEQPALNLATRLHQRGDKIVVTQIKKGYAVWIWEPEAQPVPPLTGLN